MYLTVVFYISEDGHMVGLNMYSLLCIYSNMNILKWICWYHF